VAGTTAHHILLSTIATASIVQHTASAETSHPIGVEFRPDTIIRSNGFGDGYFSTWAADDSLIVSVNDGNWLADLEPYNFDPGRWYQSGHSESYHNNLYRLTGDAGQFTRDKFGLAYPYSKGNNSWFGFGVISINGVIYSAISKTIEVQGWSTPFIGVKLLQSVDSGHSWQSINSAGASQPVLPESFASWRSDEEDLFFPPQSGKPHEKREAYPFSWLSFVQMGRDYSKNKDGYVYIYSTEGAQANNLLLARAPKAQLGQRRRWEYFVKFDESGAPIWSSDLDKRGSIYVFPDRDPQGHRFGFTSWLPSVIWNEGLGLYIMVNGGTYAGLGMSLSDTDYFYSWPHSESGSLGLWYSKTPFGPWKQFYYSDHWTADNPKNLIYWPTLSSKWISSDGKDMVLVWCDAMKNARGESHAVNYRWNQMRIHLRVGK